MRHHGDDIGVGQQVAGDPAKQALARACMAEPTNYEKFRADLTAAGKHLLANVTAPPCERVVIRPAAVTLEVTKHFLDTGTARVEPAEQDGAQTSAVPTTHPPMWVSTSRWLSVTSPARSRGSTGQPPHTP